MYFHVPSHVYLVYFNEELIALDLKRNKYIIIPKKLSDVLSFSLKNEFVLIEGRYKNISNNQIFLSDDFDHSISFLKKSQILCQKSYNHPYSGNLLDTGASAGSDNIDWDMDTQDLRRKVSKRMVLEAYITLIKVYFLLNVFGFYNLIRCIKQKKPSTYIDHKYEEFLSLSTALNRACFYFPVRTKCLEWSAALTLMGLKRYWRCNIEVGVQNLPFASHAWVKANGRVIADSQDLPETLSVILSEPF